MYGCTRLQIVLSSLLSLFREIFHRGSIRKTTIPCMCSSMPIHSIAHVTTSEMVKASLQLLISHDFKEESHQRHIVVTEAIATCKQHSKLCYFTRTRHKLQTSTTDRAKAHQRGIHKLRNRMRLTQCLETRVCVCALVRRFGLCGMLVGIKLGTCPYDALAQAFSATSLDSSMHVNPAVWDIP